MDPARLQRLVGPGLSFLVGTVGADGAPSCCRATAVVANPDLSTLSVYLPVNTAQQTVANVATTRRIAVVSTHPIDHDSLQVKGTARAVRLARTDEAPLVLSYVESFADNVEKVGVPRTLTRSVAHWPAFVIEVDVHEIFDQTPGPRAGNAIR
jgi:hypothetical protein